MTGAITFPCTCVTACWFERRGRSARTTTHRAGRPDTGLSHRADRVGEPRPGGAWRAGMDASNRTANGSSDLAADPGARSLAGIARRADVAHPHRRPELARRASTSGGSSTSRTRSARRITCSVTVQAVWVVRQEVKRPTTKGETRPSSSKMQRRDDPRETGSRYGSPSVSRDTRLPTNRGVGRPRLRRPTTRTANPAHAQTHLPQSQRRSIRSVRVRTPDSRAWPSVWARVRCPDEGFRYSLIRRGSRSRRRAAHGEARGSQAPARCIGHRTAEAPRAPGYG